MQRPLALLLLLLSFAAAQGGALARFADAYKRAETPAARADAIRVLARDGSAAAVGELFQLWRRLEGEATGLRSAIAEARTRVRDLRPRLEDPRKREATLEQIKKIDGEAAVASDRLAGLEREEGAILEGVRGQGSTEALNWLAEEGLTRAESPLLIAVAARRVAEAGAAGPQPLLVALDRAKRPEVLVPLLEAMRAHAAAVRPAFPTLLKLLKHREWPVRIAVAHLLARSASADAIEPLLAALAAEEGESRAQQEVGRALAILCGVNLGGDVALWRRWWQDHAAEVAAGTLELGKGTARGRGRDAQNRFYGIEQEEKRIIYVFDKSGSMEVSMQEPRWLKGAAVPAREDEDSRFDAARRELLRATKNLRKGSEFAVVLYSDRVEPIHDKLVPATPENHAAFSLEMGRRGPEGSTNIYEALDFALRMANVHSEGTRGEQRADAIILVSDGAPTNAKGETEDPERTLVAVRQWNAQKRIVIHTIGIGAEHNNTFMRTLAEENGGSYHAVMPDGKKAK